MRALDWLSRREQLSPNKIALIDAISGERTTYSEWNRRVNRLANWFTQLKLKKGTRVAMLAVNSASYLDVWFACGKTGTILQNLNWRLPATELTSIIKSASPEVMIHCSEFTETVQSLKDKLPSVNHWIGVDRQTQTSDSLLSDSEICSDQYIMPADITTDDPWVLCYTGGTTGETKAAILTHGNILWNAIQTCASWELRHDDMTILNAPLFHTGGLNVLTAPLVYIGGTSIICQSFDVAQMFRLLSDYPVSVLFGVPTMFHLMQEIPEWLASDFSKCRFVISGGAPCPAPIFQKFRSKKVDFKTGYGLTEAGPNTFWLPPDLCEKKAGSVGFPLMHVQVKIVKPDGSECTTDEVGELLIAGPHVTPGYWDQPESTDAVIRNGWLHTGDLARRDADGCYYIVGRKKEMFISGGENIYPIEIETVLHAHESIAESAVIGIPDEKWGEIGVAFVVARNNYSLTEAELITFLKLRLAGYKIPKIIRFLDELPKTAVNKVDKKALRFKAYL
ncbi:long-chain fatty acid--CoA ligase [bacterium]|nr:long-chain fatty acid--CoA ligase [bacterium]